MKRADMFQSYTLTYWNQIEAGTMLYVIHFEKGTEIEEAIHVTLPPPVFILVLNGISNYCQQ